MLRKNIKKTISALLIILTVFPLLFACGNDGSTIRVMVEDGEYFQVVGDSLKTVRRGDDVSFSIVIDEGCYYVSNNCGAIYSDGVLTLKNVRIPQTILLKVDISIYTAKLWGRDGMTVYHDGEAAEDGVLLEVPYGGEAVFDIRISNSYEYAGTIVICGDGSEKTGVYADGQLTVNDVRSSIEIFVQLRNTSVIPTDEVVVSLLEGEGFTISGAAEKHVVVGEDVSFEITVKDDYFYVYNNCGAEFADGKVTLRNVAANQIIMLLFRRKNTSTTYYSHGRADVTTDANGSTHLAIADTGYVFICWKYSNGTATYSYANSLTIPADTAASLKLTPDFAAISKNQIVTYHANGGNVYNSSDEYINYAFSSEIYIYPAALGEWCFKTFYRDNHAPIEFNLKADGSGRAYSLGSRIFESAETVELYLIWEKETPAGSFTYEYLQTDGINSGIKLTEYKGEDETVAIPAYIDGLPVRTVDEGCFSESDITGVVITKNIQDVEKKAFSNCRNLKTVYLCDSVENIYNESFTGCENFSELRMIAVLPPVYSNHLIGTTIRRFEQLYKTRNNGKTKVMFYGGSSIFQGIDGATVAGMFNTSYYSIINGGQNAYISGPLMLELYSIFMSTSDIMVFVPEYSKQVYSNIWELPSWIALEAFYDAFRLIDIRDYGNIFASFYDLQHGSSSFVYVGKLKQCADGKALTYEDYNNTVDEYFTRDENFEVVKASVSQEAIPINFDAVKEDVRSIINKVYLSKYVPRGLTMYFASCGMWEYAFPGDKSQYTMYETWLKSYLKFPYISNCLNHLFTISYISDSISHLTREGAVLHSRVLASEILAQMRLDGYS